MITIIQKKTSQNPSQTRCTFFSSSGPMPQPTLPSLKDFAKLIPQIKIAEVLLRGLDNFISQSRTSDQGNYAMLIMVNR